MTVAELIELLKKIPNQNAVVYHHHCFDGDPIDLDKYSVVDHGDSVAIA